MKSLSTAVTGDVWSASIKRGSHEILKKDIERNKSWTPDSYRINADRILNGELVSETWLWGRNAVALIELGYLTERQLEPHRAAFLGDIGAIADREEVRAEKEKLHAAAVQVFRESS